MIADGIILLSVFKLYFQSQVIFYDLRAIVLFSTISFPIRYSRNIYKTLSILQSFMIMIFKIFSQRWKQLNYVKKVYQIRIKHSKFGFATENNQVLQSIKMTLIREDTNLTIKLSIQVLLKIKYIIQMKKKGIIQIIAPNLSLILIQFYIKRKS